MESGHLVVDAAIALTLALTGGLLARAARLSPIVGYLVAGMLIGPFTPGYQAEGDTIHQLAELGVVFLMFGVGLHFNLADLLAVRRLAVPPALAQVAAASLVGWAGGIALGLPRAEAAVFGMALSISSTVVLVRALEERGLGSSIHGRMLIGWLIVQDLATIVMLATLPLLAGDGGLAGAAGAAIGAVGFAGVMLVAGSKLIPRLLTFVGRTGSRELFVLVMVCISLGIAAGAEFAGVSLALGAFIAGVAVSETEASHQAASDVLPLRDAFAVLFFVSVGMLIDPRLVVEEPLLLVGALILVIVVKPVVSAVLAGASPVPAQTAFIAGAGLAQAGEFSFVLADAGRELRLVAPATYSAILGAAALSIALNPFAFVTAGTLSQRFDPTGRLGRWLDRQGPPPEVPPPSQDHVVIAGGGRVGALTAEALRKLAIPSVFVEVSLEQVRGLQQQGHTAFWGDAAKGDVLDAAGIANARLLVLAVPDSGSARLAAEHAHRVNPSLRIVARAHSVQDLGILRKAAIDVLVVPEFEGAATIVRESLTLLGRAEAEVSVVADAIREEEYEFDRDARAPVSGKETPAS